MLVLGALTWPLLFTYSGFAGDWEHHLWLMWHQSLSIESGHLPSLFLNSSYSVFYPMYAFYGGTLYAVGGLLSLALGHAPISAYILIYVLDFAAAFGGWYWLGRIAGLGRWTALVPGIIFITSAYYVVIIYVQGDWPGFTGISMISPMVAAGLSVLRAERLRGGPALALAASSILFFGAHDVTILLGLSTMIPTGLAIVAFVPDARQYITRRRVARVAAVVVPSALVSAWYLLPTLVYNSSTRVASSYSHAHEAVTTTNTLVSFNHLFTFSRTGLGLPPPYYLALSLPVLAIVWLLAGILLFTRRAGNRAWTRILLICSAMALLIGIVMTHVGLMLALPRLYTLIQFSYRLEIYVIFALCGGVLAALVLARQRSLHAQVWTWLAVPVCAVSLGGAIQQLRALPYPGLDRYQAVAYQGEVDAGKNTDYQDASAPVISGRGLANLEIPFEAVHDDKVTFTTRIRPGSLAATNIGAGSYMLHLTGAKAVGVDAETGNMVVRVGSGDAGVGHPGNTDPAAGATPDETISISTANSLPIVLGRLLMFVGLAILALELLGLPIVRFLAKRTRATAEAKLAGHPRVVPSHERHR